MALVAAAAALVAVAVPGILSGSVLITLARLCLPVPPAHHAAAALLAAAVVAVVRLHWLVQLNDRAPQAHPLASPAQLA